MEDGYLAVEGNSIQEIGPTAQLEESRFAGYTVLDCRGKIITPGHDQHPQPPGR